MDVSQTENEHLHSGWWLYLIVGVFVMIAGVLAIGVPLLTTLASQAFLGVLLIVGGLGHFIHTIKVGGGAGRIILGIFATLLYLAAGWLLIMRPLAGVMTLTAMLASFFLVVGIVKIVAALLYKELPHRGWLLAGGIISLLLGLMILGSWPSSALWAIGVIVGVELIYAGWTMVALSIILHTPRASRSQFAGQH